MVVHKKAVQQVLWGAGGVGAAESIVTGSDDGFLRLFDRRKLGDDADGCCVRKLDCGAAVADIELSRSADVLGTGKRVVTVAAGKVGLAFGVERGRGRIGRAKRCDQNKTRREETRHDKTRQDVGTPNSLTQLPTHLYSILVPRPFASSTQQHGKR